MVISRTVSEINGDFSRKSQNFPTPIYFAPLLKGFLLELGTGAQSKTRMTGLPGRERSLAISSAIWIQYTNVTDGRTDTGRQLRPRLRIASRGKNERLQCDRPYKRRALRLPTTFLVDSILLQRCIRSSRKPENV